MSEPRNPRNPRVIWRVVATGGTRRWAEAASKTYTDERFVSGQAEHYRQQGAEHVRIYRGEVSWEDVTDVDPQP